MNPNDLLSNMAGGDVKPGKPKRRDARLVTVRSMVQSSLPDEPLKYRAEWIEQFTSFAKANAWMRKHLFDEDVGHKRVTHVGDDVWFVDLLPPERKPAKKGK